MSWNDLRKGRISIPYAEYFITFNCHKRTPYFTDYRLARLFCQSISHNEQKFECCWQTWVLMPDHFHGLLTLGNAQLGKVVGELKGRTAYLLNKQLDSKYKIWQSAYYDHQLRSTEDRHTIARYIAANPLRTKLVSRIGDYPYWNSHFL
ncbi:REP-associated tyrosine transposase [Pseudoalteromonas piscicida]|uniref:Transposase n=1 Tax=Pseudoalteromonas piscicida TaxID=43662 RepID=A0AAD0RK07_PSEO7|nr:transposase [Pseudoalteromonas piscicida]ASD68723.1 transposase [Pseudoalteromonas piscicida]AXR03781.1 transposase [Pseudoalteromonas piscicida]